MRRRAKPPRRPAGMALVDALVAAAVLAVGVLGAARLVLHAQASAHTARAQAQAADAQCPQSPCCRPAQAPCPAPARRPIRDGRSGSQLPAEKH